MPHLQCFGDQEVEISYKVRKKPLSAFGLTLYWSVIKVFYRTHRVFDKINLLGFNNKSVLSLPNPNIPESSVRLSLDQSE